VAAINTGCEDPPTLASGQNSAFAVSPVDDLDLELIENN